MTDVTNQMQPQTTIELSCHERDAHTEFVLFEMKTVSHVIY